MTVEAVAQKVRFIVDENGKRIHAEEATVWNRRSSELKW